MQNLADFEKEYQLAVKQADKDFKVFLNQLDENRPAPYLRLKSIELYENIMIACNVLNKVKYQVLEMTQKVNSAKASGADATASPSKKGKNKKKDDKGETESIILKLYDLTEFHSEKRSLFLGRVRKMMEKKISQKWGFFEWEHWKAMQEYLSVCMERSVP